MKGKAKQQAGQITNNPNLAAEGQNEKLAGKVQTLRLVCSVLCGAVSRTRPRKRSLISDRFTPLAMRHITYRCLQSRAR
jgi:hypothetical protein